MANHTPHKEGKQVEGEGTRTQVRQPVQWRQEPGRLLGRNVSPERLDEAIIKEILQRR